MKRQTGKWVRKAEEDTKAARILANRTPPLRDAACFHCHEAVEKYLKALLQDRGGSLLKSSDPIELLNVLLPHDETLAPLRRMLSSLRPYGQEVLYPGGGATTRGMEAALRNAERVRAEVRGRLGLPL